MAEFDQKMLKEEISTEFDYFQSEVIQAAVLNEFDRDYSPISALQEGTPIEFNIKGTDRQYLDLNKSRVEIKGKLLLADGTDLAADAAVGVSNSFLHSLFSSVETEIQGVQVGDNNTLYPYRAFIETLLSTNKLIGKTRLKTIAWERDTDEHEVDFRREVAGLNTGFKSRSTPFDLSHQVTLIGRLHSDMFHQPLDIPSNLDLKIRLLPNRAAFYIKKPAANATNYKFSITKARLLIRTKEINPSVIMAHETTLQKHNFRIPFTKVSLKRLTIPAGVTNIEYDNVFTGVMPKRLIVSMIRDIHMHGDSNTNPFYFPHFDLRLITIKVNGQDIPRIPYQPNFTNADYLREYFLFLEGLGLDLGTKSIDITPEQWARNCNFYVFRLMPSGIPSLPSIGSARIELKFGTPTPHNINLLFYSESNALMEIDRYRNIILS